MPLVPSRPTTAFSTFSTVEAIDEKLSQISGVLQAHLDGNGPKQPTWSQCWLLGDELLDRRLRLAPAAGEAA